MPARPALGGMALRSRFRMKDSSPNIHPTAVVDDGAEIGEGTSVWHFTHICSGAVVGRHCSLGQNVLVADKAVIGNGVKVQNTEA